MSLFEQYLPHSRGLIETKWTIIVVERGTSPKVIISLSKGENETLIAVDYIEVDQGNLRLL